MRFYSPSTRGFYLKALHGDSIPADAVEISEKLFNQVVTHRPASKVIVVDENGLPALADEAPISAEELQQQVYADQVRIIDAACESAITAGFVSSALGSPYRYSSQVTDQLNLTGAILSGQDMPYPCYDAQGVRDLRPHTADQLRQVGDDFTLYKLQLQQLANTLKQQLYQAFQSGDIDAMRRIIWAEPQE